jgi:rhodanese-related sulfurtransferase
MSTPDTISPEALHERLKAGKHVTIIDVREPEEYRSLHAAGALPLPLGEVSTEAVSERLGDERPTEEAIYFICHTGRRASEARARVLGDFPAAAVIEGGTLAWAQAGLPVRSGEEP